MTRDDLYRLVWSKPMTHIANAFGMSDVAVRKHCKKYAIPTPPVGYWAKLAHGKPVHKPPLPTQTFAADTLVRLFPKPAARHSSEAERATARAEATTRKLKSLLKVPDTVPVRPPVLVRELRGALRAVKADNHGFHTLGSQYRPGVSLGKASTERALRILSALATAATARGHDVFIKDKTCYWQVQEEQFEFRLYEIKDKRAHEPTAKELKVQAQVDERRARYPELYASNRKSYRSWDYFPSGRLALHIKNTTQYPGEYPAIEQRWRDRKGRALEESLVDIFIWLVSATVLARDKRLDIEERQRADAENKERDRQLAQRRANANALKKHLDELIDTHGKISQLSAMADFVSNQPGADNWPSQRFVQEVLGYKELLIKNFCTEHFEYVFDTLGITTDEDLLIAAARAFSQSQGSCLEYPYSRASSNAKKGDD